MAMPAPGRIRRGYIGVGSGQLHYRIAGQGPTVLLVPEPPRSSAVYAPLMEKLSDEFTLIALDLPGYGNSSPLTASTPAATHFAGAIAEALRGLGVARCPVYGYHGSSKIVLQLAVTHRDLVAVAVLDGLSLPLELPDAQFLQRFLPPFELSDDGSHIVREWSRILDAQRFYPWFARHERARLSSGLADAPTLHGSRRLLQELQDIPGRERRTDRCRRGWHPSGLRSYQSRLDRSCFERRHCGRSRLRYRDRSCGLECCDRSGPGTRGRNPAGTDELELGSAGIVQRSHGDERRWPFRLEPDGITEACKSC